MTKVYHIENEKAETENGMDETVPAVNYGAKGQIGEGGFRAL